MTKSLIFTLAFICITLSVHALPVNNDYGAENTSNEYSVENIFKEEDGYHSWMDIRQTVNRWRSTHPNVINIAKSGNSVHDNDVMLLKFTNFTRNMAQNGIRKARILIISGEHPRELFPVETLLSFLESLVQAINMPCDTNEYRFVNYLLDNAEIFVIPVLNPDGHLKIQETGDWCERANAHGVDLNRNMDWNFQTHSNRDSEDYSGEFPFSEPETLFLRTVLSDPGTQPDAFLSVHSGAREIITGYSDSKSKKVKKLGRYHSECIKLANAMNASTNGYFTAIGPGFELLEYSADGTIIDYVTGRTNVPYALAVEVYGTGGSEAKCFDAFNPPPSSLTESIHKVLPIYSTLINMVIRSVVGRDVGPPAYRDREQYAGDGGGDADERYCVSSRRLDDVAQKIAVMEREFDL